jgi:hypothetical protein
MGPNCSELITAIENEFGFAIPDEDAADFKTVEQLYKWVLAHRLSGKRDACLYSMTFFKVRQAMVSALNVARNAVQPKAAISSLLTKNRCRKLRELQTITNFQMPELYRPYWVVYAAALLTAVLAIASPFVLHVRVGHGAIWLILGMSIVFGYVSAWLTKFLAFAIPPEYATVELFVRGVMARNYWTIVREAEQHANAEEAWKVLQEIVGKQRNVPPERITQETSLTSGS